LPPGWGARRYIRAMLDEVVGEIHICDVQLLAVYQLLKMIADEFFISSTVIPVRA
jgi:hypothetical protein